MDLTPLLKGYYTYVTCIQNKREYQSEW